MWCVLCLQSRWNGLLERWNPIHFPATLQELPDHWSVGPEAAFGTPTLDFFLLWWTLEAFPTYDYCHNVSEVWKQHFPSFLDELTTKVNKPCLPNPSWLGCRQMGCWQADYFNHRWSPHSGPEQNWEQWQLRDYSIFSRALNLPNQSRSLWLQFNIVPRTICPGRLSSESFILCYSNSESDS